MRIALIADIHANLWALDAVLEDLERFRPAAIFNLGDILHGPLAPRETYERLRRLDVRLSIAGNQDRELWEATAQAMEHNPSLRFVLDELPPEAIEWLRQMPATAADRGIFACHGTPASDCEYLLEDVSLGHALVKDQEEIVGLLGGVRERVIVCAHTHIPRVVHLGKTGQLVVNPGSVGLPAYRGDSPGPHVMETHRPHASYALLEEGECGVTHRVVAYDWAAAKSAARLRPDWAHQIRTGRAAPIAS